MTSIVVLRGPRPLVKSVISIMIMHMCLASTMMSLPLSSHLLTLVFWLVWVIIHDGVTNLIIKSSLFYSEDLDLLFNLGSVLLRQFLHGLSCVSDS